MYDNPMSVIANDLILKHYNVFDSFLVFQVYFTFTTNHSF